MERRTGYVTVNPSLLAELLGLPNGRILHIDLQPHLDRVRFAMEHPSFEKVAAGLEPPDYDLEFGTVPVGKGVWTETSGQSEQTTGTCTGSSPVPQSPGSGLSVGRQMSKGGTCGSLM